MNDLIMQLSEMAYCEEKKLKVESLFHENYWTCLNYIDKKNLLQLLEDNFVAQDYLDEVVKIIYHVKGPNLARTRSSSEIIFSELHLKTISGVEAFCAVAHEHVHIKQFRSGNISKYKFFPYRDDVEGYTYYRLQPIEFEAHQESEEKTKEVFVKLQELYGTDCSFEEWFILTSAASPIKLVEYFNEEFGTNETVDSLQAKISGQSISR